LRCNFDVYQSVCTYESYHPTMRFHHTIYTASRCLPIAQDSLDSTIDIEFVIIIFIHLMVIFPCLALAVAVHYSGSRSLMYLELDATHQNLNLASLLANCTWKRVEWTSYVSALMLIQMPESQAIQKHLWCYVLQDKYHV
jgi:hypothetical protein